MWLLESLTFSCGLYLWLVLYFLQAVLLLTGWFCAVPSALSFLATSPAQQYLLGVILSQALSMSWHENKQSTRTHPRGALEHLLCASSLFIWVSSCLRPQNNHSSSWKTVLISPSKIPHSSFPKEYRAQSYLSMCYHLLCFQSPHLVSKFPKMLITRAYNKARHKTAAQLMIHEQTNNSYN